MTSKAPYQIRTTYLDGTVTRDMINNEFNDPHKTLMNYVARHPVFFAEVAKVDVLNLNNELLDSHEFVSTARRAA